MEQQRLFTLAVDALAITAVHAGAGGWHVVFRCRRGGESWAEGYESRYSSLSTRELLEVLWAELDNHV